MTHDFHSQAQKVSIFHLTLSGLSGVASFKETHSVSHNAFLFQLVVVNDKSVKERYFTKNAKRYFKF